MGQADYIEAAIPAWSALELASYTLMGLGALGVLVLIGILIVQWKCRCRDHY